MRRDAVCPSFDRNHRRTYGIGQCAAARIADSGDVIDVDAKTKGGRH
jgi:hypothetical protein